MMRMMDLARGGTVAVGLAGLVAACGAAPPGGSAETPAPEAAAVTDQAPTPPTGAEAGAGAAEAPVVDPQAVKAGERSINWLAARQAAGAGAPAGLVGVQAAQTLGAPVPVILPTGIAIAQAAGGPVFRVTPDGYFANYQTEAYNLTIVGTKTVYDAPAAAPAPAPADGTDPEFRYAETESGAELSFAAFGADYLMTFDCRAQSEDSPPCVSEEQAIEIAKKLAVVGGGP